MILILCYKSITGICEKGNYPGSIEVPDSLAPEGFFDNFLPGKYLYTGTEIVENPDFIPPPDPVPEEETIDYKVKTLEVETEQNKADIAYLAMMTDVDIED